MDFEKLIEEHTGKGMIEPDGLRLIAKGIELAVKWDGDWMVEIGTWNANSTAFIARCLKMLPTKRHRLYSIDAYERRTDGEPYPSPDLAANEATLRAWKVAGLVSLVAATSREAIEGQVPVGFSLVVIDGSHRYEDVAADLQLYGEELRPGGYLWLDDLKQPYVGVIQAAEEFLRWSPGWRVIERASQSVLVQKIEATCEPSP